MKITLPLTRYDQNGSGAEFGRKVAGSPTPGAADPSTPILQRALPYLGFRMSTEDWIKAGCPTEIVVDLVDTEQAP